MADNSRKTFLGRSLNRLAEKKIADAYALLAKSLPCTVVKVFDNTNTIVTVEFNVRVPNPLPQVTIPVVGWEYIRYPIQVKDAGVAIPAATLLGGVTGLGSGTPDLAVPPATLQGLMFMPIGSTKFSAVDDPQKIELYGPNGFVLRDKDNHNSIVADSTAKTLTIKDANGNQILMDQNGISITDANGNSLVMKSSGSELTLNSHTLTQHIHSQGDDSAGDSEVDVNKPTG